MPKVSKAERDEAIARLKEFLKPGDTLYTIIRQVSSSGMSRVIGVLHITPDPSEQEPNRLRIRDYSMLAARALEWRYNDKHDGVSVGGCGMDMSFHLVSTLSRLLFDSDYALNKVRL